MQSMSVLASRAAFGDASTAYSKSLINVPGYGTFQSRGVRIFASSGASGFFGRGYGSLNPVSFRSIFDDVVFCHAAPVLHETE